MTRSSFKTRADGPNLPGLPAFGVALETASSDDSFRRIFEHVGVGVAQIETATRRFVKVNRKYCEIVGLALDEITSTTDLAITHPDDLQQDLLNMARLKAGEVRQFSMEKRYLRKDGSLTWGGVTVSSMWDVGQQPGYYIATVEDVTRRKFAEESLLSSEEKFRGFVENANDAVYSLALDGTFTYVSPNAVDAVGYAPAELLGKPYAFLVHPDDLPACDEFMQRILSTGEKQAGIEYRLRHKDLGWRWHTSNASALKDREGRVVACLGISRDITERKQAELEREKLLQDLRGRLTGLQCIYGVTNAVRERTAIEEVLWDVAGIIPPALRHPEIARARIRFDGRDYACEPFEETKWKLSSDIVVRGEPQGSVEVFYLHERPERDEGPFLSEERCLIDSVAHTLSEAAERERAQNELESLRYRHIEAARWAGMAEIASTVLHNVGNVLNSLNVSTNLISDRLRRLGVSDLTRALNMIEEHSEDLGAFLTEHERGKRLPQFLVRLGRQMAAGAAMIQKEVKLAGKYVDHIKDIVSVQQSHAGLSGLIERVSLAELLEDAIRINVASARRHDVQIVREFEDLRQIAVDKQKMLLILVNLVSNAKYALIASDRNDRQIVVRLSRRGADRVRIEVEDNGVGIDAENMPHIFSLGFTTRKEGHGFGLHSAALAAQEIGAVLTARSDGPNMGATFVLELAVDAPKGGAGGLPAAVFRTGGQAGSPGKLPIGPE